MKKTAWKRYEWLCVGWGGNRAVLMKVGIWEGDFLGKNVGRETRECSILRQAFAGMAFLSSFWKANFILRSIYGGYHSGLIPFPVAPDLQWGSRSFFALWCHPCSSWCQDPGSCLFAQKGQGHPVPPPTSHSSFALLTLGLQHWPPIEYLPRPLPFLINSL